MFLSPLEQFEIYPLRSLVLLWDFSITNVTYYLFFGVGCIVIFFFLSACYSRLIPGLFQSVLELLYEFIYDMLKQTGNFPKAIPFFPLFITTFFFILTLNLIGLFPFGFTVTSHIIITFYLAFSFNLGFAILGFERHGLRFLTLFVPKGVPKVLLPLLVVIEIVSYLIRTFSLSLRLFANMMAGHTLLQILSGFIVALLSLISLLSGLALFPFMLVVAVMLLEIAIAFIQAYVFTILLFIYVSDSLNLH